MNEQIRAEFEAEAVKFSDVIEFTRDHARGRPDCYVDFTAQCAWEFWQAAHARYANTLPAPAVPEETPEVKALLMFLADGKVFDSEYDGRVYNYCSFCGVNSERRDKSHEDDCPMILARELLGNEWPEKELEPVDEWHARDYLVDIPPKIPCDICGKKVWPEGLAAHKTDSIKCKAMLTRATKDETI